MNTTNQTYKKLVQSYLAASSSDIERQILEMTTSLLKIYSFDEYQTCPRPTHPNPEKQLETYFTLIAILISLRTTLENEQKAMKAFLTRYKNPEDVLQSSVEELAEIIKPAGMPLKKAGAIIKATKFISDNSRTQNFFEYLKSIPIDIAREKLLEIPGVGQKSADCILELGLDMPSIVIDTNMFRVLSRIFDFEWQSRASFTNEKQILEVKKLVDDNLSPDGLLYQVVHTMLLLHGKFICKAKPMCSKCEFR